MKIHGQHLWNLVFGSGDSALLNGRLCGILAQNSLLRDEKLKRSKKFQSTP